MKTVNVVCNESLSKYTTIKIGGVAKKMYFPESIDELKYVTTMSCENLVIGGGSNLLIANREFDSVINMQKFDSRIINLGNGKYEVGASVRLQNLIKCINNDGYGGIEYLYSVPGLVGGAIVMNAGSGEMTKFCVGTMIESVKCLYKGKLIELKREQCQFKHRDSIFKGDEYVVVSAIFHFERVNKCISEKRREERIEFCKATQDSSAPNFGSVFKYSNYRIMRIIQILSLGKKKGVHFSRKSGNWLLNSGDGEGFNDAKRLICFVKVIHKILKKKCEVEVIIWE